MNMLADLDNLNDALTACRVAYWPQARANGTHLWSPLS
jgi:hypothetical protein